MHATLRDRYKVRGIALDVVLLICSVIFSASAFARDELLTQISLSPQRVRYVLGIASIVAFTASLLALRMDWKGRAVRHQDAATKLTNVVAHFRQLSDNDGRWSQDGREELNRVYWEAMDSVVEVPSRMFNKLKARHLRKVQVSKMLDDVPGCPVPVLHLLVFWRSMRSIGKLDASFDGGAKHDSSNDAVPPDESCGELPKGEASGHRERIQEGDRMARSDSLGSNN
jgi:hypothetical protein